ncbi:hypothetical protein EEL35_04455 [Muribaculaceae bacterium Isolate-042 (Harlan)]|nr:hypothetical protein EEL35_04455 [Muribaculaceae bacterium Isolate-042 (Harlan)]
MVEKKIWFITLKTYVLCVETELIQLLKLFWRQTAIIRYIQIFHKLQIYLLKLPLYFSTFINIVFNNCRQVLHRAKKYLHHLYMVQAFLGDVDNIYIRC